MAVREFYEKNGEELPGQVSVWHLNACLNISRPNNPNVVEFTWDAEADKGCPHDSGKSM